MATAKKPVKKFFKGTTTKKVKKPMNDVQLDHEGTTIVGDAAEIVVSPTTEEQVAKVSETAGTCEACGGSGLINDGKAVCEACGGSGVK